MQWFIIGGVAVLAFIFLLAYNGLVKTRNMCKEAWSDIDVQLKRRSELIPNLVDTVQGYSKHEQTLFSEVAALRATAINAQGVQAKGQAEEALTSGLKDLIALAEAYPQLKASVNFLALQNELIQVEDKIQFARRYYNGALRMYNNRVQAFPSNLVAKICNPFSPLFWDGGRPGRNPFLLHPYFYKRRRFHCCNGNNYGKERAS